MVANKYGRAPEDIIWILNPTHLKFESWIPATLKYESHKRAMKFESHKSQSTTYWQTEIWILNPALFEIWILNPVPVWNLNPESQTPLFQGPYIGICHAYSTGLIMNLESRHVWNLNIESLWILNPRSPLQGPYYCHPMRAIPELWTIAFFLCFYVFITKSGACKHSTGNVNPQMFTVYLSSHICSDRAFHSRGGGHSSQNLC